MCVEIHDYDPPRNHRCPLPQPFFMNIKWWMGPERRNDKSHTDKLCLSMRKAPVIIVTVITRRRTHLKRKKDCTDRRHTVYNRDRIENSIMLCKGRKSYLVVKLVTLKQRWIFTSLPVFDEENTVFPDNVNKVSNS